MVFIRYNATEANPNNNINFITALKDRGPEDEALAVKILRALAAQVRPVMKKHGLEINSFEEYEHNAVFLGRNWNNGETVEIVLRGRNGRFYGASQLISVFCHELAHIMHMDHGPDFWKYYRTLHAEVKALQRAKYFGDGFWSNGLVLHDGTQEDREVEPEDLPEYLCGGAHSQPPPKSKRRSTKQAGPSSHTGAQTQKKRKAGTRIKGQNVFKGEGKSLNADEDEETRKKLGTGFRKRAGSKRAREERVAAIEARLSRLKGKAPQGADNHRASDEDETDDEDYEFLVETDAERRRMMVGAMGDKELASLKSRARLEDFGLDKGKGKGIQNLSNDPDEMGDGSEEAQETLKKFGLSLEENVRDRSCLPTSSMTESSSKTEPSMSSIGRLKESTAVPEAGGEWACKTCTFINIKPLGLQCEMCGCVRVQ